MKINFSKDFAELSAKYGIETNKVAPMFRPSSAGTLVTRQGKATLVSTSRHKKVEKSSQVSLGDEKGNIKFTLVDPDELSGSIGDDIKCHYITFTGFSPKKNSWVTKKLLVAVVYRGQMWRTIEDEIEVEGIAEDNQALKAFTKSIVDEYEAACKSAVTGTSVKFEEEAKTRLSKLNLDETVKTLRQQKNHAEQSIKSIQDQLDNAVRTYMAAFEELEALETNMESKRAEYLAAGMSTLYAALETCDYFEFTSNGALALTKPVWIEDKIPMGRYWLVFKFTGRGAGVSVQILLDTKDGNRQNSIHPHISATGSVCYGSAAHTISTLSAQGDIGQLILIHNEFLSGFNPKSPFTRMENWDPLWPDKLGGDEDRCYKNGQTVKDKRCEKCLARKCKYLPKKES